MFAPVILAKSSRGVPPRGFPPGGGVSPVGGVTPQWESKTKTPGRGRKFQHFSAHGDMKAMEKYITLQKQKKQQKTATHPA